MVEVNTNFLSFVCKIILKRKIMNSSGNNTSSDGSSGSNDSSPSGSGQINNNTPNISGQNNASGLPSARRRIAPPSGSVRRPVSHMDQMNIFFLLTNGFTNLQTVIKIKDILEIVISLRREQNLIYGMNQVLFSINSDEELFLNCTSTWRFLQYTVTVRVMNTKIDDYYHENPGTYISTQIYETNISRSASTKPIHGSECRQRSTKIRFGLPHHKRIDGAKTNQVHARSFLHFLKCRKEKTKVYWDGAWNLYADSPWNGGRYRMDNGYDGFRYHNQCIQSPIYDIVHCRPYETTPLPPLNFLCVECNEKQVSCTIIPCIHFICSNCSLFKKLARQIYCHQCNIRIESVVQFSDFWMNFFSSYTFWIIILCDKLEKFL